MVIGNIHCKYSLLLKVMFQFALKENIPTVGVNQSVADIAGEDDKDGDSFVFSCWISRMIWMGEPMVGKLRN